MAVYMIVSSIVLLTSGANAVNNLLRTELSQNQEKKLLLISSPLEPPAVDGGNSLAVQKQEKRNHAMEGSDMRKLYLDTLRDTLTGAALKTPTVIPGEGNSSALNHLPYDADSRMQGSVWCDDCLTMAGTSRVENVRSLVEKTIADGVGGDFLETGTWRGGCSIMARAVQRVMGESADRRTYACDSFAGMPASTQEKDHDVWKKMKFMSVDEETVRDNFKSFNMLDENVRFVKGFFAQSLPKLRESMLAEGRSLAVLRGDGDMYESYMDILYNLYQFVPIGGYFICDDCPTIHVAMVAINDFRDHHGIVDKIENVTSSVEGIFWRKEHNITVNYTNYLAWNATRKYDTSYGKM